MKHGPNERSTKDVFVNKLVCLAALKNREEIEKLLSQSEFEVGQENSSGMNAIKVLGTQDKEEAAVFLLENFGPTYKEWVCPRGPVIKHEDFYTGLVIAGNKESVARIEKFFTERPACNKNDPQLNRIGIYLDETSYYCQNLYSNFACTAGVFGHGELLAQLFNKLASKHHKSVYHSILLGMVIRKDEKAFCSMVNDIKDKEEISTDPSFFIQPLLWTIDKHGLDNNIVKAVVHTLSYQKTLEALKQSSYKKVYQKIKEKDESFFVPVEENSANTPGTEAQNHEAYLTQINAIKDLFEVLQDKYKDLVDTMNHPAIQQVIQAVNLQPEGGTTQCVWGSYMQHNNMMQQHSFLPQDRSQENTSHLSASTMNSRM